MSVVRCQLSVATLTQQQTTDKGQRTATLLQESLVNKQKLCKLVQLIMGLKEISEPLVTADLPQHV